jgi:protein-disulfide isomerase
MSNRLETFVSGSLAVAAIAMAVGFIHGPFGAKPQLTHIRGATMPAEHVAEWGELLNAGILVGDSAAPVKIVELGDFECPFCRKFALRMRDARKQFGNKVALVYVDFPLKMHRFAMPAARAAECAYGQGRFAEFHDVVYDKQDSLGLKSWVSYAREAGIRDTTRFTLCNARTGPVLQATAGLAIGKRLAVHGTPTVIVNGWRLSAPPDDSTLSKLITAALAGDKQLEKLARQTQ